MINFIRDIGGQKPGQEALKLKLGHSLARTVNHAAIHRAQAYFKGSDCLDTHGAVPESGAVYQQAKL